jgi:hypothetical protein
MRQGSDDFLEEISLNRRCQKFQTYYHFFSTLIIIRMEFTGQFVHILWFKVYPTHQLLTPKLSCVVLKSLPSLDNMRLTKHFRLGFNICGIHGAKVF